MLRLAGVNKKGSDNSAALNHHSDHYSDASLVFFLWRRLISPSIEVTINCAVLSPGSLTSSIASTTSWGVRTCSFCDLALCVPVAIKLVSCGKWSTVYAKKNLIQWLTCSPLANKVDYTLNLFQWENNEAQPDGRPGWASVHNVSEVYTMAYSHSTQTRPEKTYQWRFLALNRSDMSAKFCRVSVEALTEHDARMVLAPFFILSFAGRLPVQEVANV